MDGVQEKAGLLIVTNSFNCYRACIIVLTNERITRLESNEDGNEVCVE